MKFELVHQNGTQRFYKADREIKIFPRKTFNWDEEVALSRPRLKEGVEMLDDKCYYVCVSDATTHHERLVFAAGRFEKDGEIIYAPYSMLHITGRMTMMIHGGSLSSMLDDQVYLRQISILNANTTEI